MIVMLVGSVTDTNDDADLNTPSPNDVTDDGMMIDTSDVHPRKAPSGILVTLVAMMT
jgi:hypothetical protein